MIVDRRSMLMTGTFGLGAFAVPGFAQVLTVANQRGFTHSVASGEPASDSLLFWTRFCPADGGPAELKVEVAETSDFGRVVAGGSQITGPWRDHTAKVTVEGLQPGREYHFRFIAPDGSMSPVGRTKTLPDGDAEQWRAAIFSCSNMPVGWFNAYAHAAARNDLDCTIHLGDYFYEYGLENPPPDQRVAGRPIEPAHDLVQLADYRIRYASYRADPDLQAMHARYPMIAQWDDHDSANDSWEGGAQNHQPATEGSWLARREAAVQAYREWMPVSDEPWTSYDIGTLATLFRTETRLLARTQQPDVAGLFKDADPKAALKAFRDGAWMDPAKTMMGTQQEVWLHHGLAQSVRAGRKWQVVGFGTVMGKTQCPPEASGWLARNADASTKNYVLEGIAAAEVGLPFFYDNWGGYPAARERFLRQAQAAGANLLVVTGDSHNAWAYDLAQDGRPAGVEWAGQSVTTPGLETRFAAAPSTVAKGLVAANPELKWCEISRRGYMAMTLTPTHAMNEWVVVDTVASRNPAASIMHRATISLGRNVMA